jgi:crotonobetainyl-CoA:carnitine CoA-transferase CaiB-like acyl-CoA transferase
MITRENAMLGAYRVLDLTDEQGFYGGQLLGYFGAEVIKVEPVGGDPSRRLGAFFHQEPDAQKSLYWFGFNSNKMGITLDLASADGKQVFLDLVRKSDVVLESFRPGYLASLGLGYADLEKVNPRIILTSITPFGQDGPYSKFKSSDLVAWAMGGLLAQTGDPDKPPVRVSQINFAYSMAAMDAAWGTAAALFWRTSSGLGQHVQVSVLQSVAKTNFLAHETWEITHKDNKRASSFYRVASSETTLRTVWETKDGYIAFLIFGGNWGATHDNPNLVKWMDENGMADDFIKSINWAKLSWRRTPPAEVKRIHDAVGSFFKSKTKDELFAEAVKRRIAIQPINNPVDILKHQQLKERGYWQELEHEDLKTSIRYPARPCLPSFSPCRQWRRAPHVGEHNAEIYGKLLGYSSDRIMLLKQAGVI